MIQKISNKISANLLAEGMIEEKEVELYTYAMSVLCYLLLPFVLVATMIPITGLYTEGFILLIPFTILRRYVGGFHFDNDKVCLAVSYIFLLSIQLVGKCLPDSKWYGLLALIGLLIVYLIGKGINEDICAFAKRIRKLTFDLIALCLLITIVFFEIFEFSYFKWICFGILMTFVLIMLDATIKMIKRYWPQS